MKKILLLEDNEDIRDIIVLILKKKNLEITASSSIREFRQCLDQGIYDLFILDVMLPDGNGALLSTELKKTGATSDVPILLMSANYKKNQVDSCADEFIAKPFDINDFTLQVQKMIPV